MRTLICILALLIQAQPVNDTKHGDVDARNAEVAAALAEVEKSDLATQMNMAAESKRVLLSARMYLAIKAVETYRNGSQRKDLAESERSLGNFDIHVYPGEKSTWLRKGEADSHFEVMLSPLYKVREPVLLDAPSSLGRPALYAVRKDNFIITRAAFDR